MQGKTGDGKEKVNLHAHHRQRMYEQMMETKGLGARPHQLLEVLLYLSIPRRDTNPTAHMLLNRFGSLNGVFSATPEELMEVPGIGAASALLISLVPLLIRKCAHPEKANRNRVATYQETMDSIGARLAQETEPSTYLLILDGHGIPRPLMQIWPERYTFLVEINRVILDRLYAESRQIQGVVLVERRFDTPELPTEEDIQATRRLRDFLSSIGVVLVDHVLFYRRRRVSMARLNML